MLCYRDVKCGRIHCVRGAEFPITNNKYVIKLLGGQECKVAELSDQESGVTADPGMVPTGTKCGMGMVRCLTLLAFSALTDQGKS